MKTKKLSITVVIIAVLFVMNACKKDVNTTYPTTPPVVIPTVPVGNYPAGLGSTPGTPVCKPFNLPANIVLIGEIHSSVFKSVSFDKATQNINDFIIQPKTTFLELGSGSLVQVYLKFFNKSSQPTSLIIPGGLMFCPGDSAAQTGITVQPDTIIIPGNDSIGCHIKSFCTNAHKHVPSNTKYKMLGTTLHSDLWTMVNILKNKKKIQPGSQIQSIIWHITDNGGLTESDKTYLNSLP